MSSDTALYQVIKVRLLLTLRTYKESYGGGKQMKKILFLTHIVQDENNGVWKKVTSQIKALRNLNFQVDFIYRLDSKHYIYEKDKLEFKRELPQKFFIFSDAAKIIDKSYDIIYIRKPHGGFYSVFLSKLLNKIKMINDKCVIYMEIPTYPYSNEVRSLKGYISHYAYEISMKLTKKFIDRFLCIGEVPENIYGVSAVKFRNGVDCDALKLINTKKNQIRDTFIFVGIANLVYWHGYDRLILSLRNYTGPINVLFYIIGDNEPEYTRLKNLAIEYNIEDKIIFLGRQSQLEIAEILKSVNVCVDSLGRHRSGNNKNDSIKSKEYTAMGMPFIKSHLDDSFGNEPFIYNVSSDDKTFLIQDVIEWYDKLPDRFSELEREYAINNLSWEKVFKDFFSEEFKCPFF